MAIMFINTGSGPVGGADELNAWGNIGVFAADLIKRGVPVKGIVRQAKHDHADGRYEFDVEVEDPVMAIGTIRVSMPGLPIERVRFMEEPGQDLLEFPRLYIDGSSFVWIFAVNVCVPDREIAK